MARAPGACVVHRPAALGAGGLLGSPTGPAQLRGLHQERAAMKWTELLALFGMVLVAAALVAVPVFLVLSRRGRRRDRTRSAGSTLAQRVVSVAQAVVQSRLVSQIGMVQRITVNSIGYLRARLLPAGGAGLLSLGEEREAVVALDQDYHLEVRHQEDAPASYSGARVRLMPLAAPQRL